ncbi:MAG TPA: hypothetical protein VGK97_09675 [Spongiibacteraceae bacterium]|jgi:hypothetical protein
MSIKKSRAIMLAAATATLFAGGLSVATNVHADEAKVHCGGITSCKGTSDCKTAENSCKGQNSCKGHGFKAVTKAECDKKGGKVLE